MKQFIQSCLLKIYALVVRTGLLSTTWGRSLFHATYNVYKLLIEARGVNSLRSHVKPGEVIIDIGANQGFFTKRFARWVSDGGFVIAVEPESDNFKRLQRNLHNGGLAQAVRTIQGAAAERPGVLKLAINPIHPGDHKIATEGLDVTAYTIDELVKAKKAPRVCLIKIDVQGAEERVLQGAEKTIRRDYPAILVEVDDEALQGMGSSAERILKRLMNLGYVIKPMGKKAHFDPISATDALALCRNGRYADLLFIQAPNGR